MRRLLSALSLMLAVTNCQAAVITQYTNTTVFTSLLGPGYFQSDFSTLGSGPQAAATVTLNGGAPVLGVDFSTRNPADTAVGGGLYVINSAGLPKVLSTMSGGDALTVTGSFSAIGGNWFLSNSADAFTPGGVTLTFSDGTSFTISSTALGNSFRGFISDTPLSFVIIKPATSGGGAFVSMDNLSVSLVPEPSGMVCLLSGLSLLGFHRRRSQH